MDQNGCKGPQLVPCVHSLAHCTWFLVIQAVFNSLKGEKLAPNWPQPLALAAKITRKWTKYGPKWPKMATKGPPSTVWLYPGLMYLIWGPFTQFWDTETAKIASELAHFLYFNFQPSGGWGTHLVSLKFIFFAFLDHTGSHKSPKNYRGLTTFGGANPFLSEPQCKALDILTLLAPKQPQNNEKMATSFSDHDCMN